MMLGQEPQSEGRIKVSINVKPAYMPQIIEFENKEATVLATLRDATDYLEPKARSVLAKFNFRAPDVLKKVGSLSGGEKSRLKLCILMQSNVNFLILDEPTNHLDIASREWVEDVLGDFDGAMIFVSHDRYFLNKFADKVWSMENGEISKFDYGYDEYLEKTKTE
jgi:ATPase subunit of ABC transporter with duplicated ATPase domains